VNRRAITEKYVRDNAPPRSELVVPADAVITPLARDYAREQGIRIVRGSETDAAVSAPSRNPSPTGAPVHTVQNPLDAQPITTVIVGSDHGGYALKQTLIPYVKELGYKVIDCGPSGPESVDYPDYALRVALEVSGRLDRAGIMIDGAGIGSAMAANKVPGIRAALCYDLSSARNAREHNYTNYLTLGGRLIGEGLAREIVKTWLGTPYGETRHKKRVEKILSIERKFTSGIDRRER
jgi:ribose 5-phosphate isomerase B